LRDAEETETSEGPIYSFSRIADGITAISQQAGASRFSRSLLRVTSVLAARMVGVGEFEQFDRRAVFDYERDADAVGWAVRRNQDFAASKLGGEIGHFKGDVRNVPDEIRDRCVRFETHPLHAEFAFLVADDKDFKVF
jgi:hypothetical protein